MEFQEKTLSGYDYFLVLYMSFDKFLLAVESRDLSQADKSIIRVSSFPGSFRVNVMYSVCHKVVSSFIHLWHLSRQRYNKLKTTLFFITT